MHTFFARLEFSFIHQIHKYCEITTTARGRNGHKKEKQIINWWTVQIFVQNPSISTYAHRSNRFVFEFYFSCVRACVCVRAGQIEFLFYLDVYVIYKFYFNNRHSINLVWCCSTYVICMHVTYLRAKKKLEKPPCPYRYSVWTHSSKSSIMRKKRMIFLLLSVMSFFQSLIPINIFRRIATIGKKNVRRKSEK